MALKDCDTDDLVELAAKGDASATQQLLVRHRPRLKRMVAARMDRRLLRRLDASDVVQEILAQAWRELPAYLEERPLPFYPWLRQLAWKRLVGLHRQHLQAKRRSLRREVELALPLPEGSTLELARRVVASGTSPSDRLLRKELCERAEAALRELGEQDRELLILRYLEHHSTAEIAEVLGVSEAAVKMRHLRAIHRLRRLLAGEAGGND